jgi:hypothetical protein
MALGGLWLKVTQVSAGAIGHTILGEVEGKIGGRWESGIGEWALVHTGHQDPLPSPWALPLPRKFGGKK